MNLTMTAADMLLRRGGGAPPFEPVITTLFASLLSSYSAPETGTATLSHTRDFESSQLLSTGLYSDAAHNVAAYKWDAGLGRSRFKSTSYVQGYGVLFGKNRDLTQSGWTHTNITAAKNQTGITGVSNSASSLTAGAANGTSIFDLGTISSGVQSFQLHAKRLTGTGAVEITLNGGSTWTAIPLTSEWQQFHITATLANPDIGIRIATSGDAIAVDAVNAYPTVATATDPFIGRSDVRNSSLRFSSISPTLAPGPRYMASFKVRHRTNLAAQLILDNGTAVNQDGIRCIHGADGKWSVASWRGSVNQTNAGLSAAPVALDGVDQQIDMIWGGGQVDFVIDGALVGTVDSVNKQDPNTLSRVVIDGGGEFTDLKVQTVASRNIIIAGDSIPANAYLSTLMRAGLDPYAYRWANRGVGGNLITDVTARVSTDITPTFIAGADKNRVLVWVGTNPLAANSPASTCLTQLATLISTIKGAAAFEVYMIEVLRRGDGFSNGANAASFETQRLLYNAGLTAAGADKVLSLDSIPETLDFTNTTYFDSFKIHPTNALNDLIAPKIINFVK